ncbi:alanine--tRNA ligase [Helicobacter mustelae]|uniref:Alanine--tRNA ligase n=1 Tax=Helicobacter mustelae (strain ATCC 43772 / CCUG 25715 / CIP 103759 / LMG 18044 / NCTC 12198 / R85-136P) TaxID=679897 RepID=D3UHC3_HELM1|nr:alanine--tRNA ligase [Helicobacter mustelae]CBG39895.1 alanyl-tRNA synthetase [Helicobacter mustelae 12198]SQH71406.1 alanyl-tRNA synthetase [Helicobacter mustelae]
MLDIRKKFLDFFQSKGHQVYASMPLVPEDASLLFTNAGMVQFKDIFTGKIPTPSIPRATSSQLCIRAGGKHNDLENVGFTRRHHTLFEMLGNFSFGDYFKKEAIAYAWEFVTEVLGFDKEVLYISIHESDDEAFEIWSKYVNPDRIKRMGDKDNFWQMGDTGACGPCSEIFVDQGSSFASSEDYFGGDGDRFLEIWNLVFMQYERKSDGTLIPLPKPSIDTGMGLERVSALLEGKESNFDSHLFMPLIKEVEKLCGKPYHYESGASYRVIADHARAVAFLLAQGSNFDKEGRGYVLRRILRRAVRHGYLLGFEGAFFYRIVEKVCEEMGGFYTYLLEQKNFISMQTKMEEERFFETIEQGIHLFKKELERMREMGEKVFDGNIAFRLYDTFGFPLDLTQDMLKEENLELDLAGFESSMQKQKQLAKSSWKGSGDPLIKGDFKQVLQEFGSNIFNGYTHDRHHSKILALFDENLERQEILQKEGYILLDTTPLYPESGGAIGDRGVLLENGECIAKILDTKKYFGLNISQISPKKPLKVGEIYEVLVDHSRQEIAKHHSATHLLHAILREKFGSQVAQAGSLVEANRLRFDFSFPRPITKEELLEIQDSVNALIAKNLPARVEHMEIGQAKTRGAIALFGEKYGENVRVVSFGEESCELCGGIHVQNTGFIGNFYITKENGVSSGVRRIEAVCGNAGYLHAKESLLHNQQIKEILKNQDMMLGVAKLKEKIKTLEKQLQNPKKDTSLQVQQINGISLIVQITESTEIKKLIDEAKNHYDKVAILLINEKNLAIAAGSKNTNIKADDWVKKTAQILGGNGGGRDDFATAGGKEHSKIKAALQSAILYAKEKL